MQLRLPQPNALIKAWSRLDTIESSIEVSQDYCNDLEEEIADLQSDLESERDHLFDLKEQRMETNEQVDRLEALENLTTSLVTRRAELKSVLYSDVFPIEDGMFYQDNPYTLTRDRWEIEVACGGIIPLDIGFGLIYYDKYTPIIVWGGQGFPHPDSPLSLLYFAKKDAVRG